MIIFRQYDFNPLKISELKRKNDCFFEKQNRRFPILGIMTIDNYFTPKLYNK